MVMCPPPSECPFFPMPTIHSRSPKQWTHLGDTVALIVCASYNLSDTTRLRKSASAFSLYPSMRCQETCVRSTRVTS